MTTLDQLSTDTSPLAGRVAKWQVARSAACTHCGICVEVCPTGVHSTGDGFSRIPQPRSELCAGIGCLGDRDCTTECPEKALVVSPASGYQLLGDPRWTADLLTSTWFEAEHGVAPRRELMNLLPGSAGRLPALPSGCRPLASYHSQHGAVQEYRVGRSGGGFDLLRFSVEDEEAKEVASGRSSIESIKALYRQALSEVDLTLPLNRRDEGERITLGVPWYGGGMSYGSISQFVMVARATAAQRLGTFTSTGEGGYPLDLVRFKDHVITQVATGLFGVREETLQWARIIEIKYAQGAKPGLGGHLLADKVTRDVAEVREAVEHTNLFSPFPFHSVYSVEDHRKHVDWLKAINPKALISVKVSTPEDVDMVAVGSYYAGANIIHLDGGYGGTGAAPDIAKKNIAMPIEYAIPRAHRFLEKEGIRDEVTLMASGGLRTPYDVAKAIALGADGVILGTAELVALECVRCANCESGRGCPKGIATTDPGLSPIINSEWGAQRIINMYSAWQGELALLLRRLGLRSIAELRGRTDLLRRGKNR
ncbi:MAG: glutamate synthase-related protein [Chloroflexota bacterium]|jgi:glutamate synthase domain-containing protein 2/ferredoxin